MKKYSVLILLPVLLLLGSCNLLQVDNDEKLSGDDFWQDSRNVEPFAVSMYNSFRNATMTLCAQLTVSGDFRCAPIGIYGNLNSYKYFTYMMNNNMSELVNYGHSGWEFSQISKWNLFYEVIQEANILIREIDRVDGMNGTEISQYKAEAVFMRNLSYFFMVRMFGDIPYYTNAYNSTPLPRTNMVTVLKNCLADLQELLDDDPEAVILPWTYANAAKVGIRANRGGTIALMMHINMWLAGFDEETASSVYYRNVVTLGDQLVNQNGGAYGLLDLDRNSVIFKGGTAEGLFEIAQNITSGEVFLRNAVFSNSVIEYNEFGRLRPTIYYTNEFLMDLFPRAEKDRRVEKWFNENIYAADGGSGNDYKEITKFLNADVDAQGRSTSNSGNQIIFRYAGAILLYAEAAAELNDDATARRLLNMVRDRAGASEVTAGDKELKDAIYWERVRELIGEGHYFYDLVRTKKICDPNYCYHSMSRRNFKAGAWTWPIHPDAMINNTHMTLNNYWR